MVDVDVIAAKLRELRKRVAKVRRLGGEAGSHLGDEDSLELLAFNLMLAIQACLDIASHLIADERWEPAGTLGESFHRLAQERVISDATASALARAAGLRNLVAHGYATLDPDRVRSAAVAGTADLENFVNEIAGWVRTRAASAPNPA